MFNKIQVNFIKTKVGFVAFPCGRPTQNAGGLVGFA
jgi:hypothetical protein